MTQVMLGKTDIKVGPLSYGCWRFAQNTPNEGQALIEAALGHGMTLIDTADIYGFGEPHTFTTDRGFGESEAVLGQILKSSPALRDKMVLATKGGIIPPRPYDSSYDYLTGALEASLTRLKTDVVDLYMIHRPSLTESFADAGKALDALVDSGKTKHVGVSNFTASQAAALQANMRAPLQVHQNEFSAIVQTPITDGILDQCQERSMSLMAWSALGKGQIPKGDVHSARQPVIDILDRLAKQHGVTRTQIALAFVLRHPANPIAIIGTQKVERIQEAAGALRVNLSARDWYDIIEAYRGRPMP